MRGKVTSKFDERCPENIVIKKYVCKQTGVGHSKYLLYLFFRGNEKTNHIGGITTNPTNNKNIR